MQQALTGGCPTWLTDLVQLWHDNKASVLILNYDTFIERTATTIGTEPSGNRVSKTLNCEDIYPIPLTPGFSLRE